MGQVSSTIDLMADIARILRSEMERQELSFNELARRAELRPSVVHQVLTGTDPRLTTLLAILDALGKSLTWLDRERKK